MSTTARIVIQSKDRLSGTPDSFAVAVPPLLALESISLLSAAVANTLYNINASNNIVYWNRGGPLAVAIPPGAYSVTAFMLTLGTLMDAADGVESYSVGYSETTMKLSITCTAPFSLTCATTTNAAWVPMGWGGAASTGAAVTHVAPKVIRLDFPNYLCINVGEWAPASLATTANVRSNFIISIQQNSQYVSFSNQLATFDNSSAYSARNGLSRMEVRLTDPSGNSVDLNGAEWTMVIELGMGVQR